MTNHSCSFQRFSCLPSRSTASATVAAAASHERNQMWSIRVIHRQSTLCHMAGSNLASSTFCVVYVHVFLYCVCECLCVRLCVCVSGWEVEWYFHTTSWPPLPLALSRLSFGPQADSHKSFDMWHKAYHGTIPGKVRSILDHGGLLLPGKYVTAVTLLARKPSKYVPKIFSLKTVYYCWCIILFPFLSSL